MLGVVVTVMLGYAPISIAAVIGGTIMVDGTVLNSKGDAKNALIGTPSSGPQADTWDNENWQAFIKLYQDTFPPEERFPSPSLLA